MFYYILDQQAQKKEFQKNLDKIHLRMTDLGITGRQEKATITKDVSRLTEEAIESEKNTVVVIGTDDSAIKAINEIAKVGSQKIFGYIPVEKSYLSEIFGTNPHVDACKDIAKRNVVRVDLGKINNHYFLTKCVIGEDRITEKKEGILSKTRQIIKKKKNPPSLYVQYHDGFRLRADVESIYVGNTYNKKELKKMKMFGARIVENFFSDGYFDVLFKTENKKQKGLETFFRASGVVIDSVEKNFEYTVDGTLSFKAEKLAIKNIEQKINIIIGSRGLLG